MMAAVLCTPFRMSLYPLFIFEPYESGMEAVGGQFFNEKQRSDGCRV